MMEVKVNYSGLSLNLVPRMRQVMDTITKDPTTNMLIEQSTTKLTINFGHLGVGDDENGFLLATTAGNRQTITFNLDRIKPGLNSNGEVVFDTGFGTEKPVYATAVHEVSHVEFPDLTNHSARLEPVATDLIKGQFAAGELTFRLITLQQIKVLFNTTDQIEQDALQAAKNELNSNPTTKPSVSGINWNSLDADQIYVLLSDKSSSFIRICRQRHALGLTI